VATTPRRPRKSATPVVRIIEAHGSARSGWEAAVKAAVKSVAAEVEHPVAVEVDRLWADLDGSKVSRYRATVKVAYRQSLAGPPRQSSQSSQSGSSRSGRSGRSGASPAPTRRPI